MGEKEKKKTKDFLRKKKRESREISSENDSPERHIKARNKMMIFETVDEDEIMRFSDERYHIMKN